MLVGSVGSEKVSPSCFNTREYPQLFREQTEWNQENFCEWKRNLYLPEIFFFCERPSNMLVHGFHVQWELFSHSYGWKSVWTDWEMNKCFKTFSYKLDEAVKQHTNCFGGVLGVLGVRHAEMIQFQSARRVCNSKWIEFKQQSSWKVQSSQPNSIAIWWNI